MKKPLTQWVCDTCSQIIENPEDGWVEWCHDSKVINDFHIVHHATKSPLGHGGCYHTFGGGYIQNASLVEFVGTSGLTRFLAMLDRGWILDPDEEFKPKVTSFREYSEYFRRLVLPYYEEARLYFHKAQDDGFFDGLNEIHIYSEKILIEIIMNYGEEDNEPTDA